LTPITLLKVAVFAAALLPAAALVHGFFTNNLTANPGEYITNQTGTWTLAFLMISLAVTPVRRLTGWHPLVKFRRMLGLFAFFYATLHVLTWVVFISFFDIGVMVEDVVRRPFITVGMAAYVILLALALTSNVFSIRRLGRRWQTLHRFVYVAAIAGVVHFWWLVKADTSAPQRWALVLALLLGFRVWWMLRARMLSRS
jgi:methionine sulfoxide reductase heme-binding subunit